MFYVRRALALILGFVTAACALGSLQDLSTLLSLHASRFSGEIAAANSSLVANVLIGALLLWLTISLWTGRAWRFMGAPHRTEQP